MNEEWDLPLLRSYLNEQDRDFYREFRLYDEIDSTNTALKRLALEGAAQGTVVFSRRQTTGRGRMGRGFVSPPGGVYMSVLLRPSVPVQDSAAVTACSAVCVAEAVEAECAAHAKIKWVNDVLLDGKKFCGILTESVVRDPSAAAFLVLGIGLNINTDTAAFEPDTAKVSISIREKTGKEQNCARVAAALLGGLRVFYQGFPDNLEEYAGRYRARLATIGKTVVVCGDENRTPYRAVDIDGRFGLVVRDAQGQTRTLRSGEVSVRPQTAQES